MKALLLLSLLSGLLTLVTASYGGHDLFTSLSQLHSLWKNEQDFVNKMETTIDNMEKMLTVMKRYVRHYKLLKLDKEPNFDYLGHPMNSYFLVRHVALAYEHLAVQLSPILNATIEFIENVRDRPETEMLPAHRDVQGAAFGLSRLHSLYGIQTDRMIDEGIIQTHFDNKDILSEPSEMKFNSWDLTLIANQANQNGQYNTMIDFAKKALDKGRYEEETGTFEGDIFEQSKETAEALEGHYKKYIIIHDQTLDKKGSRFGQSRTHELPVDKKLRKKKKFHKKPEAYVPIRRAIPRHEMKPELEVEHTFKALYQKEMLCSGDTFRTPNETKDLYCFYGHNGSPWLRLGPMRVEIQNFDPYVAVFRNLMYEHECDNVTQFLAPFLGFPPGRMSGRKVSNDWTMKNVWPNEDDNVSLEKMTRRVEHMMDILAASNKGHSDNFMCGNYGIGGHYGTHPDYYDYKEEAFYDPESKINRISTVMTVLEAPEAGGATVWPYLGVYVMPEKGSAVAWYNTRSDAHVDYETQHAACPVLLGQKWIGNKWIAYKSQWQKKQCTFEPFSRLPGPRF